MQDKKVDKKIAELNNNLKQLENLLYSSKSQEGVILLKVIENSLLYHKKQLELISLQPLPAPYYEYDKTDLQKMKSLRAKIDVLTELIDKFDISVLEQSVIDARNKVQAIAAGEALEPSY